MQYLRTWVVLALVWVVTALPLAQMMADSLWHGNLPEIVFLWFLLAAACLVPFAHRFIHPDRPFRLAVLVAGLGLAALFAFGFYESRWNDDLFLIPVVWAAVLFSSDWLFRMTRAGESVQLGSNEIAALRLLWYPTAFIGAAALGAFILLLVALSFTGDLPPLSYVRPWEWATMIAVFVAFSTALWAVLSYRRPSKIVRYTSNAVLLIAGLFSALSLFSDFVTVGLQQDGLALTGEQYAGLPFYPALAYLIALSFWGRTRRD